MSNAMASTCRSPCLIRHLPLSTKLFSSRAYTNSGYWTRTLLNHKYGAKEAYNISQLFFPSNERSQLWTPINRPCSAEVVTARLIESIITCINQLNWRASSTYHDGLAMLDEIIKLVKYYIHTEEEKVSILHDFYNLQRQPLDGLGSGGRPPPPSYKYLLSIRRKQSR